MAQKKKRAAWGSKKKRAQELAAANGAAAAADLLATEEPEAEASTRPSVGDAIENVKNWLAPFEPGERKQILRAVGVFLK